MIQCKNINTLVKNRIDGTFLNFLSLNKSYHSFQSTYSLTFTFYLYTNFTSHIYMRWGTGKRVINFLLDWGTSYRSGRPSTFSIGIRRCQRASSSEVICLVANETSLTSGFQGRAISANVVINMAEGTYRLHVTPHQM